MLRDVAADPRGAHERLSPLLTQELLAAVVEAVPDDWLEQAPGLDTPEAARAAYVEHLLRRAASPAAWLPGGAS